MDEMQSIMNEAPGRRIGTNGKGDSDRVKNKRKFDTGHDEIAWPSKAEPLAPGQFRKSRKVYK